MFTPLNNNSNFQYISKFDETPDILTTKIENVTEASSDYEKQIKIFNGRNVH